MAFYIYACYIYTKDLYNRYIKILSVTFFSCPNIFNQINILRKKILQRKKTEEKYYKR